MITPFTPVPGWFPHTNVDGGIAVGDVDDDGVPDLVVFMIGAPPGPNSGYYRVGHGLVGGSVTGGWGPWQAVPDWPFWENAGGGIALADLDGSGSLDLVVFTVDAPEGPNIGLVRVARGLAADGTVTGGWGPWQTVPDWPFWESQGADCAVADVDRDGRAELVLLVADAPHGTNIGLYRTAALAADGAASGWTPWTPVPDWTADDNAGVGISVADLDGDGVPELLVMAVEVLPQQNRARYTVGWHLDHRGRPADGWGPWREVPDWPFWENQGGAVDLVDLSADGAGVGAPELAVFCIDDPVGQNIGLFRFLSVETDLATAAVEGVWRILEVGSGVLAVHAALLPDSGGVLFFAGSSNDPAAAAAQRYGTRVWHYPDPEFSAPVTPVDLFCCGHARLPDGRLLAAGGTERYDPFHGLRQAVAFDQDAGPVDPASPTGRAGAWVAQPAMDQGRWYPSLVALTDGAVLAVSGLGADGHLSVVPECFDGTGWTKLPVSPPWPMYAHLFLLADGRIFYSGGQYGANNGQRPSIWDPVTNVVTEVPGLPVPAFRNQSASVLLPPAQDQRVLVVGGGGADIHAIGTTATAAVADLSDPHPAYVEVPRLHHARMHLCATLLPDRTVLVSGGSGMEESHAHVSPHAEIYHPDTNSWRGTAASRVNRLYHSIALLTADGKVVTAGSNPERTVEEMRIEVFWPPYLFAGPRPSVAPVSTELSYGQIVVATVEAANGLREASLLRPGATTHSSDTEQRLVDVPVRVIGSDTVELELPADAALAPPGVYLLVVVDVDGVPSEGVWVRLS